MYYSPVEGGSDNEKGTDLNAGTNGPEIYMYYATTWGVNQFNAKVGKDTRKNLSPKPEKYFGSPLTRLCFTRYDRVPYSKDSGVAKDFGDDERAWEYILYSDYSGPVDMNDGTVKLDEDYHTVNNHISMFAQREDGSVKAGAEIIGGYTGGSTQVGEMWLNR